MRTIGKYEVRGILGRGGMSRVYKVSMPVLGKIVALKLLEPHPNLLELLGHDELKRLFTSEAVAMAGLRHPHVADIRDFDTDRDGRPFYVMEYYCRNLGGMIGERFRVEEPSRQLDPDRVLQYGLQTADGLACLHQAGIIHRDIKPYNILITDHDSVKIADFGLSKLHGEPFPKRPGLNVGSPYYTAPEQVRDPEEADERADIYSLGVMLYRLLTGRLPEGEAPAPVSSLNPLLDTAWDDFFRPVLAGRRRERFRNVREVLAALKNLRRHWRENRASACRLARAEPPPADTGRIRLRQRPLKVSPRQGREVFDLNRLWRPRRYLKNDFTGHGAATVLDRATGLVWQRSGSDYPMTWDQARVYIDRLEQQRPAGITGWRLPTVAELISLLTAASPAEKYCIPSLFDRSKRGLWSADRRSAVAAWYVSVDVGYVGWQDCTCHFFVRAVSGGGNGNTR